MKASEKTADPDIASPAFWAKTWEKLARRSRLRRSQERHPERWAAFYDRVADLWQIMGGGDERLEKRIVKELISSQAVSPGETALELGCGPGNYTLPLVKAGVRVFALDLSSAMVEVLRRRATAYGIGLRALKIIQRDWEEFKPRNRFPLVLAAGFPQAFSPSGIEGMESLSRGRCALILGSGEEPFPFRRLLWQRIMGSDLAPDRAGLSCLINYLWVSGRNPHLRHFCQTVTLCLPAERVAFFYREYFRIFGKVGKGTEGMIREVLSPFEKKGQIRCRGKRGTALVWWEIPDPPPRPGQGP